jgi:hypothetical protein
MQDYEPVSMESFHKLTQPLVGLPLSGTWRGYGSALFLELGLLTPSAQKPKGEASVMIEWSWRVESPRAIAFGSWSGVRRIDRGIQSLAGSVIEDISLVGRLPEISIRLSDKRWIQSCMTTDGQPEWAIVLRERSWLCVKRGRVCIHAADKRKDSHAAK